MTFHTHITSALCTSFVTNSMHRGYIGLAVANIERRVGFAEMP